MTKRVIAMTIDLKTLQSKAPLDRLPEAQLERIAASAVLTEHHKGDTIFDVGDTDSRHPYLLWGRVWMKSADNKTTTLTHNSDSSRFALAQLRPRRFRAEAALNGTCILWVDGDLLADCVSECNGSQPQLGEEILITA